MVEKVQADSMIYTVLPPAHPPHCRALNQIGVGCLARLCQDAPHLGVMLPNLGVSPVLFIFRQLQFIWDTPSDFFTRYTAPERRPNTEAIKLLLAYSPWRATHHQPNSLSQNYLHPVSYLSDRATLGHPETELLYRSHYPGGTTSITRACGPPQGLGSPFFLRLCHTHDKCSIGIFQALVRVVISICTHFVLHHPCRGLKGPCCHGQK